MEQERPPRPDRDWGDTVDRLKDVLASLRREFDSARARGDEEEMDYLAVEYRRKNLELQNAIIRDNTERESVNAYWTPEKIAAENAEVAAAREALGLPQIDHAEAERPPERRPPHGGSTKRGPVKGGSTMRKVSIASQRRQADAAANVMTRGWGRTWMTEPAAKAVHEELCKAMEENAHELIGKGLNEWKGGALQAVKLAKQATAIDVRQACGAPPRRVGAPPAIPMVPPETKQEHAAQRAIQTTTKQRLQKMTRGTGANSRNDIGMPYNIDSFRRPYATPARGGVMMSGIPANDTLPARNMKSGLDLEALTPETETCDISFNVGGSDAPIEDWTNAGLRKTQSGLQLFQDVGPRLPTHA